MAIREKSHGIKSYWNTIHRIQHHYNCTVGEAKQRYANNNYNLTGNNEVATSKPPQNVISLNGFSVASVLNAAKEKLSTMESEISSKEAELKSLQEEQAKLQKLVAAIES